MAQIETNLEISAPVEKVWKVLMDFEAYSEWNPFIKEAEYSQKSFRIVVDMGGSTATFKPTINKVEKNKELSWTGHLWGIKGLFSGRHYFTLESENGETKFVHGERFSGIFAPLILFLSKRSIRNNFERMNQALASRVLESK